MRIDHLEIDDDNVDHVTSHGVSLADIEAVFMSRPNIYRNKGGRAAALRCRQRHPRQLPLTLRRRTTDQCLEVVTWMRGCRT